MDGIYSSDTGSVHPLLDVPVEQPELDSHDGQGQEDLEERDVLHRRVVRRQVPEQEVVVVRARCYVVICRLEVVVRHFQGLHHYHHVFAVLLVQVFWLEGEVVQAVESE